MTEEVDTQKKPIYVITCGDEGIQINDGRRLSFAGAGVKLEYFSEAVQALKKLLESDIYIVSNQESDWTKEKFNLDDWEQANATMQQHVEAVADKEGLKYAGFLQFTDPKKMKYEIKGHMVRPPKIHVASKICFTLGGGEQTFNLSCFQISAEWLHLVSKKVAESVIKAQVDFYQSVASKGSFYPEDGMRFTYEIKGDLGEEIALKNKKILEKMGFELDEPEVRGEN